METINPDGVEIEVPWREMEVGSSVFIPCFRTFDAALQIKRLGLALNMRFRTMPKLEGGYRGLRVWRVR